jgi:hypothetical protein
MGILKEQVLWIERFETHEALRTRVREFARTYNQSWLLERHGYRTPIEARRHLVRQVLVA